MINEMVSKKMGKKKQGQGREYQHDTLGYHTKVFSKDGVRHELTAEVKEPQIPVLALTDSLWRKGRYFTVLPCSANQRQWYCPPTYLLDTATENQLMSWQYFQHCMWNPGPAQASGIF